MFDYKKLRGKIREVFGTQENFANALGISKVSLSLKLNNTRDFTQGEISKAAALLEIKPSDVPAYFFAQKVQKFEQKSC